MNIAQIVNDTKLDAAPRTLVRIPYRKVLKDMVFRPVLEHRTMREHRLVEVRNGKRVTFRREPTNPPRAVHFEHEPGRHAPDSRTYVKVDANSVCVENGADAIFNPKDLVEVIGNIDEVLAAAEARL